MVRLGSTEGTTRPSSLRAAMVAIVPALAAVVALRLFVVGLYRVPTESMAPTILPGSCVAGERVSYRLRPPSVGDVVTFDSPEEAGVTLVKRVVATEGQVVDYDGRRILVDGEEPAGAQDAGAVAELPKGTVSYPHVVSRGCVWVMGDNRANSRDSRWFGDVPVSSVTSRVLASYWPPDLAGPVG